MELNKWVVGGGIALGAVLLLGRSGNQSSNISANSLALAVQQNTATALASLNMQTEVAKSNSQLAGVQLQILSNVAQGQSNERQAAMQTASGILTQGILSKASATNGLDFVTNLTGIKAAEKTESKRLDVQREYEMKALDTQVKIADVQASTAKYIANQQALTTMYVAKKMAKSNPGGIVPLLSTIFGGVSQVANTFGGFMR